MQQGRPVDPPESRRRPALMLARRRPALTRGRRAVRLAIGSVAVVATLVASLDSVSATPPPNPTNGQISAAQSAKEQVAANVGDLSAQVVTAQNQLQQLQANVELTEQKFALAQSQLGDARQQATAAQQAVVTAQRAIDAARAKLGSFVHSSYISPSLTSPAGNLLSAADPNAALQRGDYFRYLGERHLDAVQQLDRATIAKSNADATAKQTVQRQQQLAAVAAAAQHAAAAAYSAGQDQTAALQGQLDSVQAQLVAAQQRLADLNGQRKTYDAYVIKQARLAAIKKAKEEAAQRAAAALAKKIAAENAARLLEQQRKAQLAEQQRLAQLAEQQRQEQLHAAQPVQGGASQPAPVSSGTPGPVSVAAPAAPVPVAGSLGNWTPALGQAAVNRAKSWLNENYSWAAGNFLGPTYGVNSPGTDGYNDSQVYGFDCSGLTLYSWAGEGLLLTHYAATQYTQAGSVHPDSSSFMPGDLLFWSSDGTIGGIHHVAIYLGGGDVIQAPYSGSTVQVTPWDQVSAGYFGATRPLT